MFGYTILNTETNRYEIGSKKRTDAHIAIERDELGICTNIEGLRVQEADEAQAKLIADAKTVKTEQLNTLVITANTVPFDADNQSINYMSSVVGLAGFKYNQAISSGISVDEAYTAIYKTKINWKNANNTISIVQIETVAEALENAMNEVATIITT